MKLLFAQCPLCNRRSASVQSHGLSAPKPRTCEVCGEDTLLYCRLSFTQEVTCVGGGTPRGLRREGAAGVGPETLGAGA